MEKPIITRFAPSPTGFLHIGSIRTALFGYFLAKQTNGTFILRIEDTDKAREVIGSTEHIMQSLKWLGIDWDFGPDKPGEFGSCIQSERLPIYKKYAEKLIEKGLAYPDPYTESELTAMREEAKANNRPFLYREYRPETFAVWDGSKPLRLKVPEIKRYEWEDAVRGKLSAGPEMLDDIILIKSDGYPTYNFAHIVDDLEMGVTHVLRGDEFISSTPKFLSIYDALEITYPIFVSLPPILKDDRSKKLGKRDGAKDILEYQTEGYLPEAMVNFLSLIGWNPGTTQEVFTTEELIAAFSIDKIQSSGGAFNQEKLLWMNKQHLQQKPQDFKLEYLLSAIPDDKKSLPQFSVERCERILGVIFEKVSTKTEITAAFAAGEYDWVFTTPDYEIEMLKWKNDTAVSETKPRLAKIVTILTETDFSSAAEIKDAIWPYAEEVGRGEVLWPFRVALTGLERSPDPFICAFTLGKAETIKRLEATL